MTLNRNLLCLLVVLLTAMPQLAAAQSDTINLRPKWKPGHTAIYEIWSQRDRNESMTFNGQTRSAGYQITTTGQVTWKVLNVKADGSSTCTMTTDWLKIERKGEEGPDLVGDSRKGGDNPMAKFVKALAGESVTIEVSPDGVIDSIKGVDKITKKGDNPEAMPSENDWIAMASSMATLPGAPDKLKIGGKWSKQDTWEGEPLLGPTPIDRDTTLTTKLESVGEMEGVPVATLSQTEKFKLSFDKSDLPDDALPIKLKVNKANSEADTFFDLDLGEVVARLDRSEATITMTVTLPQGRGALVRTVKRNDQGQILRTKVVEGK